MSVVNITEASGLQVSNNNLNNAPGGCLVGDNLVVRKPNVYERRPGHVPIQSGSGDFLAIYGHFLISPKRSSGYVYTKCVERDVAFTSLTSASPNLVSYYGNEVFNFVSASNKNFYYTTILGPYKISHSSEVFFANNIPVASAPVRAGVPRALDGTGVTSGAAGWFNDSSNVAYQIVFGYTDLVGNLNLGAPSQIISVSNTSGGARTVDLTFSLPRGLTTSYFYQIYRSDQTNSTSIPAGINYQLVAKNSLVAGDISAGYVTVTDSLPDASRGAFIYTDATQEGELQANDIPPICYDIAEWNGMTFYMNVTPPYSATINLATVGGSGLVNDDIVYLVNGATTGSTKYDYTGKASQNNASHQFAVVTGGTATQNIIDTAKNLVECINRDTRSVGIHARYVGDDLGPGEIYLERDASVAATLFSVYSTRAAAFNPSIGLSGSTVLTVATAKNIKNGIYISKVGLPECVPLSQIVYVGAGDCQIFKGIGLVDAFYIFTSGGVFRITGSTPSEITISLLYKDITISNLSDYGYQSINLMDNNIYVASPGKVTLINSSGRAEISIPVSEMLVNTVVSVVNNEQKEYMLGVHDGFLVYNSKTNVWTLWTGLGEANGVYDSITKKMFFILGGVLTVESSQNSSFYNNISGLYFDGLSFLTVTDSVGDILEVDDSSGVVAGDLLYSRNSLNVVTVVSMPDSTHVKVTPAVSWPSGALTSEVIYICRQNTAKLTYTPIHGGAPGYLKKWGSFKWHVISNGSVSLGVYSDANVTPSTTTATPIMSTLAPLRTMTPLEMVCSHWLVPSISVSSYLTSLAVHGASVDFEVVSDRGR